MVTPSERFAEVPPVRGIGSALHPQSGLVHPTQQRDDHLLAPRLASDRDCDMLDVSLLMMKVLPVQEPALARVQNSSDDRVAGI